MHQEDALPAGSLPWLAAIQARTPARILLGRAGNAYRTATQLQLRQDHAAARDAVLADLIPDRDFGADFVSRWHLFEVKTAARNKADFLLQPERGRILGDAAIDMLAREGTAARQLQVVIADGLSATAVRVQVPLLLPLLAAEAERQCWTWGRPFVVHNGRVGLLNAIGEVLDPEVVVLLIGERPGLATAESLSAYLAYRPRPGHTDAQRNLISNIHARGLPPEQAAPRILALAAKMRNAQLSGIAIKEDLPETNRPILEGRA